MRPRVVAVSAATLIAAASVSPVAAQAAGQNAIYVNSSDSACTDSGSGTLDTPFCTIQAAADAANPGDVVLISSGTYASGAVITRSGTASEPIVFSGGPRSATIGEGGSTATSELTISGASNVEVENLVVYTGTSVALTVDGGSDDTIADDAFYGTVSAPTVTSVLVTGGASATTVRDSRVSYGVEVDGGSTGTVVSTNQITGGATDPISVQDATDTAVTSNTVSGSVNSTVSCESAISVAGSTNTSIENNVVGVGTAASCPSGPPFGVQVDTGSAGSTTLDYNDVAVSGGTAYSWDGNPYSTASALYATEGQGRHDYNGSDGNEIAEQSPIINSANSAAVGEQPVDINGDPRTLDPLVTPTGAGPYDYYDRGAVQFQDPYAAASNATASVSATKVPLGTTITADARLTDTWGDSFGSYEFDFGGSATPVTSSTPTATWTPTAVGTYAVTVSAAAAGSSVYHSLQGMTEPVVTVVAPQPLVANETLTAKGLAGVVASDTGTTDAWNISSVVFNFGDGTPTQTTGDGDAVSHTYAKAGTYTITETVTDQDGNTASTSSSFTTTNPPPGTLRIVQGAGEAPAGSTGIAQASITSGIGDSDDFQILAATTSGQAELALGDMNMNWQAWQVLSQPGVSVKWVGIAGLPNGSSQLIEITSSGELLHTVRNANGTWQAGWGSPAGSTGFVNASITAMPDGSTQLVAVTTAGVVMHNIRFANGSWQGWHPLTQSGVKVVEASIAGLPDGSSQFVEVTSTGVMKHNIRNANGSWQPQGWGAPSGSTGIKQVAIAGLPDGSTQIEAIQTDGVAVFTARQSNGAWNAWQGVQQNQMLSVANISVTSVPPEYGVETLAVSGD